MNLSGGPADRRAFTSAVVAVFEEQCDFAGVPRLHSEIKKKPCRVSQTTLHML